MITQVNPNDATVAYTSRTDAVMAIRDIIAYGSDGAVSASEYDVETIADEALARQGEGRMLHFFIGQESEEFWKTMMRHAL